MKYTLLINFLPSDSYDGEPGEDSHGKYILFDSKLYGVISAPDFLMTESGEQIQICEQAQQILNGIKYLKLYYQ